MQVYVAQYDEWSERHGFAAPSGTFLHNEHIQKAAFRHKEDENLVHLHHCWGNSKVKRWEIPEIKHYKFY